MPMDDLTPTPPPITEPAPIPHRTKTFIGVVIFVVLAIALLAYLAIRSRTALAPTVSPTTSATVTPAHDYSSTQYNIAFDYPKEFKLDDSAENQIELRKINPTTSETTELLIFSPKIDAKYFLPKTTPKDYEPAVQRSVMIGTTTYEGIFYKPSVTAPAGRGLLVFVLVPRQDDISTGVFLAADDEAGIDMMLKILETVVL